MNNSNTNSQTQSQNFSLDEVIANKTVASLYKVLPSSILATIIVATFIITVLWQVIDTTILTIWFAVIVSINLVRFALYKIYIRNKNKIFDWEKVFFILLLVNALGFSCVSIWLLPDVDSVYHYFPVMVLIGMSAGSVSSLSYRMKNIISYFILLLGPIFVVEVLIGTYISYSVAMMCVLLALFSLGNARRFNQTEIENITLHYKSKKLHQELVTSRNIAIDANNTKTNFISMISHELRTPLNAMLGYSQLLKMSDSPALNEEQDEQAQGIIDSGKHLLSLIEDLLDLSKIEAAQLSVTIEDVSLKNTLDESIAILEPIAIAHHSDITVTLKNDYLVRADHKRLKQIFINLISNAIKYNHEYGRISISANKIPDGFIRISVSDDGNGLTVEQQSELFQIFKRFDEKEEGLGLGLFITKKLVTVMGGKIGVKSQVNEGSIFWFDLLLVK